MPLRGDQYFALQLAVCAPAPVTRFPGTVPGPCFADSHSPWPPPLAPPTPQPVARPCSSASQLLAGSDFSRSYIIDYGSSPSRHGPVRHVGWLWPTMRSPGSRAKSVRTCQCLRPRRVVWALALSRPSVLPSVSGTTSAPGRRVLSRLNGWPTHSPVNASPWSSRATAHDSGPMWIATPSS